MRLYWGVRKRLSSLIGREDSAFILSDIPYLLSKRDTPARFLWASTVAAFPDMKPVTVHDCRGTALMFTIIRHLHFGKARIMYQSVQLTLLAVGDMRAYVWSKGGFQ